MTAINSPYLWFANDDGTPIDSGALYIGTAGLDPEVSPIAVYADSALTIAVPQPVAIDGGYAVRAGSPARLFCAATSYSMRVRNRLNEQVIYGTNISPLSAGEIAFTVGAEYATGTIGKALSDLIEPITETGYDLMAATDVAAVRTAIGAAESGANSDITSLQDGCTATTQADTENNDKLATMANIAAIRAASFGFGQTRQDVTASRAADTDYTNDTARPIFISIQSGVAINTTYTLTVGGVMVQKYVTGASYVNSLNFSAIVLPGETYRANFTVSGIWCEVRG